MEASKWRGWKAAADQLELDDPALESRGDRFGAMADIQFLQYVGYVGLDGAFADGQVC